MANQIKGKYIKNGAIDGSKVLLLNDQALRAVKADGSAEELLKLDGSNNLVLLKVPQVTVDATNANDLVRKSQLDSSVEAEASLRESQVNALQSQIDSVLSNTDPAALDSLSEIVAAFQEADSDLNGAITTLASSAGSALEAEISARQAADLAEQSARQAAVAAEQSAREAADAALQSGLDAEVSARQAADVAEQSARQAADVAEQSAREAADAALQSGLDAEVSARQAAVAAEQSAREAADLAEQSARQAADAALQSGLDAEVSARQAADVAEQSAREAAISAESSARQSAISAESSARQSADAALQSQINNILSNTDPAALDSLSEIVAAFQQADSDINGAISTLANNGGSSLVAEASVRQAADEAEASARQAADEAEASARQAADEALQFDLDAEASVRAAADTILQANIEAESSARAAAIEAEVSARNAAINSEANTRSMADASLQSSIDSEANTRSMADASLQSAINSEVSARQAADSALDARVTALETTPIAFAKEKFVITSTDISNGYIELQNEAVELSIVAHVDRLAIHPFDGTDGDYTVSVQGGKTRITFAGHLVVPSEESLSAGDIVRVTYGYLTNNSGGGGGGGGATAPTGTLLGTFNSYDGSNMLAINLPPNTGVPGMKFTIYNLTDGIYMAGGANWSTNTYGGTYFVVGTLGAYNYSLEATKMYRGVFLDSEGINVVGITDDFDGSAHSAPVVPVITGSAQTYGDWNNLSVDISSINKSAVNQITLYLSAWNGSSGTAEIGLYLNGDLQESVTTPSLSDSSTAQAVPLNFVNSYDITQANIWELRFISRPYFTSVYYGTGYSPELTWYTSNRGTFPGVAYEVNGGAASFSPGTTPVVQTQFNFSPALGHLPSTTFSLSSGDADYLLLGGTGNGMLRLVQNLGSSTVVDISNVNFMPYPDFPGYQQLVVSSAGASSDPIWTSEGFLYGDSMSSNRAQALGLNSLSQIWSDWEGVTIDVSVLNTTVQNIRLYGDMGAPVPVSLTKNGVVQETVNAVGSSTGLWNIKEPFPIEIVFSTAYNIDTNDVWKLEFANGYQYHLALTSSAYPLNTSNRGPQGSVKLEANYVDSLALVDQSGLPSIMGVTMKRLAVGSGTAAAVGDSLTVKYAIAYSVDLSDADKANFILENLMDGATPFVKSGLVNTDSMLGYMEGSLPGEVRVVRVPAKQVVTGGTLGTFYIYIKNTPN